MTENDAITAFLAEQHFAVAGASTNRTKYGNKVLRCYQQHDRAVVAVNPRAEEIEGALSYATLGAIPGQPPALSIITPPAITEALIEDAAAAGIRHVWMQPGAESPLAVSRARDLGMNVIAGGACLLVVLGFHE